jgi:outer membrane lipoprotein-sorting protein
VLSLSKHERSSGRSDPGFCYAPEHVVRRLFSLFVLFLAVGLSSCAVSRPPQPLKVPTTELPSAQQLFAGLETRRQALTGLRGLARVTYADAQDKGTAKQAVAISTPDRFRMELFSPIGIASLSVCDGHTLAAYFPTDKTLYRGAATPLNVARFTRVLLSPREVVSVLFGLPPLPQQKDALSVNVDEEQGWYRCHLSLSDGSAQVWWFEPNTLLLRRWAVTANNGAILAYMNLADYRNINGQAFPFEIVLSDKQNQQEASIHYEQIELNPSLSDALFMLAPINGVREIDVDALNP